MARVFITGSADGLGRATAKTLLDAGHEVVVHVRNENRRSAVDDLVGRGAVVVGDLSSLDQTRDIARDVNRLGPMDAVIHNAGVYSGPHVMPVNIVAPYLLTALIDRPKRLIYLSSGMHRSGRPDLAGHRLEWPPQWVVFRQQALRHDPRRRHRPPLAGRGQQRRRPRLGADEDGRTRRPRRPAARTPDAGVARHQRRSRSAHVRRLLAPPAPDRAAPGRPRPAIPGRPTRPPRCLHRHPPR